MSLLNQLSSQVGDKTEQANRIVVAHCLEEPNLLKTIAEGLNSGNPKLIGDCAEVFTKVAEDRPDLVVPYADDLLPLLAHKTTRVRWEAMHAIALIADRIPEKMTPLLPQLAELLTRDSSTIVRDYATDALGLFATSGEQAARLAYPLLQDALHVWEGKHRARALKGMTHVITAVPTLADELRLLAAPYTTDSRGVVKKAAKELVKAIDRMDNPKPL